MPCKKQAWNHKCFAGDVYASEYPRKQLESNLVTRKSLNINQIII